MKSCLLFEIISIFSLILFVKALDNHTLSNYKDITLTNLSGIFEPDFNEKVVKGNLTYTFFANNKGSFIKLDSRAIQIINIIQLENGKELTYKYGEKTKFLGTPIIIDCEYEKNQTIILNINYKTTKEGGSAQFLDVSQTIGKTQPYFFSLSALIYGRDLLPSQDTPAVKFPFYLGIKVMNPLRGMISGLYDKNETNSDNSTTFYYYQKIPIATYLISLAAGNIVEKKVNEQISVFTEPEYIDAAVKEFEDMPKFLEYAISYMGDYEWGKYNVLVLPNSFPYSGMENPCLTFCSPCLINGDKSLVDLIAHELIHSWSGNLVTNENWRDFWLNEGVTKFLQRKVIAKWRGDDYAKMDYILGLSYIRKYLGVFGENNTLTSLRPEINDLSPDSTYSNIPYEKGSNFVYYLEGIIGNDNMQKFFKSYFTHFKYKSVDFFDFQNYFIDFCKNEGIKEEILNSIKWDEWVFQPGDCPVPNNFNNTYNDQLQRVLDKFINENYTNLTSEFSEMIASAKTVFFLTLEERNIFLSENQHAFLTNELKLYENQNYLVTTHYLRLILKETDKFYDHEMDSLLNYLNTYGVSDFMDGIYRLFYKRDEIRANETLSNLKNFYHSAMYDMAKNEIEEARDTFPILSLDVDKGQCSLYSKDNNKFNITSNEYKDTLAKITIDNGIYLNSTKDPIKVECTLNTYEKYCLVKDVMDTTGEYNLIVKERIQKKEYAIKVQNSTTPYKIFFNDFSVINTSKNSYEIDYAEESNDSKIKLELSNQPDKISVMNGDKELNCMLGNLTVECNIANENLPFDETKPNEFKEYNLKVVNYCGQEKYSLSVKVKDSKKEGQTEGGLGVLVIVLIVVGALILFLIIAFFVHRAIKRKNNKSSEDEGETRDEKLMQE